MGRRPATIREAHAAPAWLMGFLFWSLVAMVLLLFGCAAHGQSGVITTVVGPGLRGSASGDALQLPTGVAVSGSGPGAVIYTADAYSCVVWQTQGGQTSVYAGELGQCAGGSPGSSPTTTSLIYPVSVALCGGNLFIASNGFDPFVFNSSSDIGGAIDEVTSGGAISALPLPGGSGGGPLHPVSVACDSSGNVYVASYYYIQDGGFGAQVNQFSPSAASGGWTVGAPVSGLFDQAYTSIAVNPSNGDLYGILGGQVGEGWLGTPLLSGSSIRDITQDASGLTGGNTFFNADALAFDSAGNIYISEAASIDQYSSYVERVQSDGTQTIVAGTGMFGYGGDGGLGTAAEVFGVDELAFDSSGVLYMADSENQRIRRIHPTTPGPSSLTVSSSSVPQSSGAQFGTLQGVLNPTTGDFFYVNGANTVNVINSGTNPNTGTVYVCPVCERIFASIPVGANNGGSVSTLTMVVDPTRNLVYVSNSADGNLYAIDGNPGTSTSYTVLNPNGLPLDNAHTSLLAIDTGLNEIYAAGPSSTIVSAVRGGRTPSLIGNTPSLEAPIESLSVDAATHAVYAMGVLVEGYGGDYPLLYTMTPAVSGGALTVDTTQIPAVGQALPAGSFLTNSIASDPLSGSLIVSGGDYYNQTVDETIAFDIFTFSPGMSEAPLPYPWQPYTTSLDVPNRAFYITDFDGNVNDPSSNATMVVGMDSVSAGDNTLVSTGIPVFGGTVSSPQTAPSPHVYDIEPDTSSYQAWISGSDATDGGFVRLWDSSTQAVILSAAIPSLGGGHLFIDSANHGAYLLDHVNGLLWLINKPQWTPAPAPQFSQASGSSSVTITSSNNDVIFYTTDGTPPVLSSTTVSCASPCSVPVSPDIFTTIDAVEYSSENVAASNVAQGTFTQQVITNLGLAVPSPATTGATITATATLSPTASTVTGTANFFADGMAIPNCSDVSFIYSAGSWQAECPFVEDTAGSYTISATFSGDALNTPSASNQVTLLVNQGNTPILDDVPNSSAAIAINANQSGQSFNAVLNNDSSVSILLDGGLFPGVGCPAYPGISGVSTGAIYADGGSSSVYFAFIFNGVLYAAYESFDLSGECTPGPLLTLSTEPNSNVEMNVDVAQGYMYVANTFGANSDLLYILPTAPWSSTALPTPTQLNLDYSATYGPIVIDPSNHQVYINDLGGSAYGSAGTYATSGFFVYDPNQSTTPANNLQHVVGYVSGQTTTPFNVGTLLDNGSGKLVLVNENPNASSANLNVPIAILDTTQFSFFTNTQRGTASNTVNITPGSGFSTISATSQYTAIGGADVDIANNVAYVFAFNSNSPATPGLLLEYSLAPGAATPETVLSGSIAMPVSYDYEGPWSQLNYDAESTEIVLSAYAYGSGALGFTSPLCAGNPSLTQLEGNEGSPTPLDFPVVNTISGYAYAVQPGSGYPPGPGAILFVAPPPSGCSSPPPSPAAISPVSGGGQSATIGQAFTNPLVVNVTDASGNPVSGATVTFTAPSSGASATLSSMTATTDSSGNASVTATANGIASSTAYAVSATVAGVTTPAAFSLTNAQAATTVLVTPSTLALVYGQPVTIHAAISPSSVAGSNPTGSVAFYDGTAALTPDSTVSSAAASYTVSVPAVGSHTYAAQYLGDTNFTASARTSASSAVVVGKASVVLTGPATQPVRVKGGTSGSIGVSIAGQYTGNGIATPTGGLSYSVSGNAFGPGSLLVANGAASISVPSTVAVGTYTVTVSYAGDLNYNANSIQIQLVIYQPISIGPATLPAGVVGGAYSQTLSATGGSGSGFTWTVTSGTALSAVSLTLSPSGAISGDPTGTEVAAPLTVQVTDSLGDIASQAYQLTIYPALGISPAVLPIGVIGRSYSQTLTATGGSGSGYQWGVTSGTALSAVGLSLSSGGVISGTPTGAESGAAFTVDVVDSLGNVTTTTYHLTINPKLSITLTTLPAGTVGTAYSQQLSATGGSGSGYVFAVTAGTGLSAVGLTLSPSGAIGGTPKGPETATAFTVQVTDSLGDVAIEDFALTINGTSAESTCPTGTACVNDPETITVNDSITQVHLIDISDPETITVNDSATQAQLIDVSDPETITVTDIDQVSAAHSIGGIVSGLSSGVSLTLLDNGGDSLTVSSNGAFVFAAALASGASYKVTIGAQPSGETCTVTNGSGTVASANVTNVTVSCKAATTTTLLISPSPASAGQPVTFAARIVGANGGTPTGTVTFTCMNYAPGQSIDSGPIALTSGVADWITASLAGDVYSSCFIATYSGDANFLASSSAAESLTVADFQIQFPTPPNLVLFPGQSTSYTFTVAPANGAYNGTVDFALTGLPTGYAASFSPSSVTLGTSPVTVTVTITAPALAELQEPARRPGAPTPLVLALLLPLIGLAGVRRRLRRGAWLALLVLSSFVTLAGLGACGGGFFNETPQNHTLTLTATSGTAQHSTTLTLTVE